jgi:ankyrin repeat protein
MKRVAPFVAALLFTSSLFAQDFLELTAGGRISDRNDLGGTPLMLASLRNSPEIVSALLKAGANVADRDKSEQTALMYATRGNRNPNVISLLITASAEVNDRDKRGRTPLAYAAMLSNQVPEILSLLLQAGAKVDDQDTDGWTPLMYAVKYNENPVVASVLLKAGAHFYTDKYQRGPIMVAAQYNPNADVMSVLLQAAENGGPDDRDWHWATALMYAAMYTENPEIITVLLKAGADGRLVSQDEKTAYDYAKYNPKLIGTQQYSELEKANESRVRD